MPEINFSLEGIKNSKLLSDLDTSKASGPDGVLLLSFIVRMRSHVC